MSQVESISIGNELKDSLKPTDKWVSNGINWLTDIESFYRERALIEKEYSNKLQILCKKHFEKKSKISTHLSVGDEPQITPGSLESASLVLWNEVLTQTEEIATEKSNFSSELNTKISEKILSLQSKSERIRKKLSSTHEAILTDRNRVYEELNKSKKHYDALCQSMENARLKNEKSPSDKTSKKLKEKEVEMNNGKNEYLININISNRIKDKYFYQDLPEVLDHYQELNESRIVILNKLIKNAIIIEKNSLDKCKEKFTNIDEILSQNNPILDTSMFIKHNKIDWNEPPDNYYIPSPIWHDDENLIITESELNVLKRKLNKSYELLSNYEQSCIDSKQKLEEIKSNSKDSSELTLNFDGDLSKAIGVLENFIITDNKRVCSQVEIEIIQNYAGDKDLSYTEAAPIKKSKFGFLKKITPSAASNNDGISTLNRSDTIATSGTNGSHKTIGSNSGLFNLRRNRATSNASSAALGSNNDGNQERGKALYRYDATADDEITVDSNEEFAILEFDDGSGWTKINVHGSEGLVPTSYIEILSIPATTSNATKKKGPSVAPKRGAKKVRYVEAIYDYQASGDDEISISQGDRIIVVNGDNGGWTEGELGGIKGLFPTSYVKDV